MKKPYRQCVVAVIQNGRGQVLAGERADQKGAWQLPQGGIDAGESAEQAVLRELREEIGTDAVRIIRRGPDTVRYDFPEVMQRDIMKSYSGQEQVWFLLELSDGAKPDLAKSEGEFQNLAWLEPSQLIDNIISWKQDAYKKGFAAFGMK